MKSESNSLSSDRAGSDASPDSSAVNGDNASRASEGPSRAEHLAWCKKRALQYIDAGDAQGAFASMTSDLQKHPQTANHIGCQLGMLQMIGGMLSTPYEMRHFIEGFN